MSNQKLVTNAITCKICKQEIVSKHRHDFVTCKCGAISVDGGNDYRRLIGNPANIIDTAEYDDKGRIYKVHKELETSEERNAKSNGGMTILDILINSKVCMTHAEARRLISCGVISQHGYVFQKQDDMIEPLPLYPIQIGKHRVINSINDVVAIAQPIKKVQFYLIDRDAINIFDNLDITTLDYVSTEDLDTIIDALAEFEYDTEEQAESFRAGMIAANGINYSNYSFVTPEEVRAIKEVLAEREEAENA